MKKVLTMMIVLVGSAVGHYSVAKNYSDSSERYADEYQKHISATCPIAQSSIKNFVYFARDADAIYDHPLINNDSFAGAQVMYTWRELEPKKGEYDFSKIEQAVLYLKEHHKKLFIQLQDATFDPNNIAVPEYLLTEAYDGGAVYQHDDDGKPEGWVAKRWDANVQKRFGALLKALGDEFDGRVEGINLQETAIGVEKDPSFDENRYVEGIKANMTAMKRAFSSSTTMQYANFMPGEWLPWEDKGYLKSIYLYGDKIGVGLGAPDLMMQRKGQLNHALAMMHEYDYSTPLGIAVQDGNYIGQTNSNEVKKSRKNIVPALHSFASSFLHVNYIFWSNQEPYFSEDVLSCFE